MKHVARPFAAAVVLLLLGSVIASTALAGSTGFPVKITSIKLFGKVLMKSNGHTLYYLKTEKDGKIHCTSSCASIWPPLLLPKGGKVEKTMKGAPGKFATIKRPDHHVQITYNGWPLYTYSGDTAAHQTHGNGIQAIWFVAKTSLAKPSAAKKKSGGY